MNGLLKISWRGIVKLCSYGMVAICFYYLWGILDQQTANFDGHINGSVLLVCALLVVVGLITSLLSAWGWWWQLRDSYTLSKTYVFGVYGLSQIAKYLPGNVGHVLGRMALSRDTIRARDVSTSLMLEVLMFAAIHAGLGLLFIGRFPQVEISSTYVGALLLAGLLATYPAYLFFRKRFGITHISGRSLLGILIVTSTGALLAGFGNWLLIQAYAGPGLATFEQCLAGMSIAFIAGFFTPGAPGGVGVREATFVLLFGGIVGQTLALEIVVLQRIISLLVDVALFVIAKLVTVLKVPLPNDMM